MFLELWNSMRGYAVIEVSGFSVERFVNLATHKGVYIWDVKYVGSAVEMKVSAKAFKLLRSCAHKTKCKVRIKSKHGYPFLAFRYRKRKVLLLGTLFFIAFLYFLSSFVWLVEISGNERVSAEEISKLMEQNGLKLGQLKSKIQVDAVEDSILNAFSEISWIDIFIKGTRATVSIAETLPKQDIVDRSTPCNIVAKKDGLIVSIATSAGTPLVKEHDVVKKGDLLVSGELMVKDDETGQIKEYVRARSEIWGKMYYEIKFEVPYTCTEKKFTGNVKKNYGINLFGKNINLIRTSKMFESYDKIISRNQIKFGENYPLPVIIITEECREFAPVEKKRSVEQCKQLAEKMLNGRIIREFDFEADIYDKQISYEEEADCLRVSAMITSLERIDETVELTPQPTE